MNWYLVVLRKYAVFSGRARRQEYWMFALVNIVILLALTVLHLKLLYVLYSLALLLPGLGVFVRRLHDTNRSGLWFFLALAPPVGVILLLVFLVQDGTPGNNRYGGDPKGIGP